MGSLPLIQQMERILEINALQHVTTAFERRYPTRMESDGFHGLPGKIKAMSAERTYLVFLDSERMLEAGPLKIPQELPSATSKSSPTSHSSSAPRPL